jgi:hypothetical protein
MFGCSFIFGTGVTDEHTIPYFLEKLSGRQVVNLGVGGSSIQTALYNGIVLNNSKYLTPKFIIPFWTSLDRHQIYLKNKIENYGFWNFNESPLNSNKNHAIIQNLLNIKIFRSLWKNKTIYREYTLFSEQVDLINKMDDNISCIHLKCSGGGARDCGHNGPIENFKIAEKIYKSIKHFL